jgi:hypothetical protein
MRKKFLRPSDLSAEQRRHLFRVLARPLIRILYSAMFVWAGFILAVLVFTRAWRPDIDTNGLPFILAVFPVSCLVCAGAATVGHVLFVRWLIRYRSRRRGRPAAMRWFLGPSDREPSRWRRLWLAAYGVTEADRSECFGPPDRLGGGA